MKFEMICPKARDCTNKDHCKAYIPHEYYPWCCDDGSCEDGNGNIQYIKCVPMEERK